MSLNITYPNYTAYVGNKKYPPVTPKNSFIKRTTGKNISFTGDDSGNSSFWGDLWQGTKSVIGTISPEAENRLNYSEQATRFAQRSAEEGKRAVELGQASIEDGNTSKVFAKAALGMSDPPNASYITSNEATPPSSAGQETPPNVEPSTAPSPPIDNGDMANAASPPSLPDGVEGKDWIRDPETGKIYTAGKMDASRIDPNNVNVLNHVKEVDITTPEYQAKLAAEKNDASIMGIVHGNSTIGDGTGKAANWFFNTVGGNGKETSFWGQTLCENISNFIALKSGGVQNGSEIIGGIHLTPGIIAVGIVGFSLWYYLSHRNN